MPLVHPPTCCHLLLKYYIKCNKDFDIIQREREREREREYYIIMYYNTTNHQKSGYRKMNQQVDFFLFHYTSYIQWILRY